MGMVLAIHTIGDENLARAINDPFHIWKIVAADDPEIYEEFLEAMRLESPTYVDESLKEGDAKQNTELILGEGEGDGIDLDKARHGIHYLLTGTTWGGNRPLNFLVCGGVEIGRVGDEFDTVRAFDSADVKEIVLALDKITPAFLRDRFKPNEMMGMGIYPEIWDGHSDDNNLLEYCTDHFEQAKELLHKAADRDLGIFMYIC